MAGKHIKKNVAEVTLAPPGSWGDGVESPTGSTTWTATSPDATITVTFLDEREPQVHLECPSGSKVKESVSGSIHVTVP